ncbi:HNH endonuclease [Mycolicibacter terrae]|uniref:HNH endonuclease n=1 Tax=Mycolicibacter terrae TaxID=1788 RepID=A0ACD2ENI5_9MYCO|nr:HNH endonuclease signature motif containing protein [Mycolicibacter terrae]RRR45067.1 HNH endonuclease [Mycolicibacter terrae]
MTAAEILDFVRRRMRQSSYYQPLVIRALITAGGSLSQEELAKELLLEDRFAVEKAVRTLMRWPKSTLEKHGIIAYDRKSRTFQLLVDLEDSTVREQIVTECDLAIRGWQQKESPRAVSRFFSVIEAAGGRCQACGVPGSVRPIDVDHIVPRSHSVKGFVTLRDGCRVPVDDLRNLQALCSRCNRGKRDASTFDFRPTRERLAETIRDVLEHGANLGYEPSELMAMVTIEATDSDAVQPESS